jgi:hypothetical protein
MNYIVRELEDLTHSLPNPKAGHNFAEDLIKLLPKPTMGRTVPKILYT